MKRLTTISSLVALIALGRAASADPGERSDGQRYLGLCHRLVGDGSCEVVTDWSVQKTVDVDEADQPNRQGVAYTVRLIEGQSRYELGMTSVVELDGTIAEGTQVRGIVLSLQRADEPAPGEQARYTTIAGALIGAADAACGCPSVAPGTVGAGGLTVTMHDTAGNPIEDGGDVLIENLAFGQHVNVQLDATYDLSAALVLPGDLVRIQACVQFAPADEVEFEGCFDQGGSVRSSRACTGFEFDEYATPDDKGRVTLEEALQVPSHPWILLNGFKARTASLLVAPNNTLVPVVPGAPPVVFDVIAEGAPSTETIVNVKGDISCADIVDCGGPSMCQGTVTNVATLDFEDERGRVSSSVTTTVWCAAHRCTPAEVATCDDGDPCTTDACEIGVGCVNTVHDGACEDGDACTSGEMCVAGECVAGTVETCADDGNNCTVEQCDPQLGCVRTNLANRSRCEDGNPCTVDDLCMEGHCASGAAVSCDDHNPCTTDSCGPDGACINAPTTGTAGSCDDGNACTVGDYCNAGSCVAGVGPVCADDGNPCTVESCEPGVGCVSSTRPDTSSCEDGNACTQGDQCMGGVCRPGTAASCDDQNPCTNDGCDAQLGCYNAPRAGACDDGTACSSASMCQDGQCRGTVLVDCNDDNPCTTDSCDPVQGCKNVAVGNGGSCDDGDACTTGESCQGGACIASELTQCDDDNPCTTSACLPGEGCVQVPRTGSCEDGDRCTGPDTCQSGVCVGGAALSCNDNNPCTTDSCSASGGCRNLATSGGACDDDDVCTGAGVCALGVCAKGPRLSCDDGNPCTADQCDPVQGCVQTPTSGTCDDGDACTGVGQCSLGMCQRGQGIICDDGDECTADTCKAGIGCTTLPRSDFPCSDGDACTINDTCRNGACVAGATLDCDDGNPCTADSCGAEGCINRAISGGCNDGNACTIGDTCAAGVCQPGAPKSCADADACTTDQCVPETGACTNTRLASGTVCEDGDDCTGCPWPEASVSRGYHALDATPDTAYFPTAATAVLELDQFVGAGTGKVSLTAQSDLRVVVLPNGTMVVRGTLNLPTAGSMRVDVEAWTIDMAFTFRGLGRAGQGATAYQEMPAAVQSAIYTDGWEYWGLSTGASLVRSQPTPDSATLLADPGLLSLPLQLGLRANGRNLGFGAAMPVRWERGTRAGTGVLRVNLERVHCQNADVCSTSMCVGGTVATECRDIQQGDYCTYSDSDFGTACVAASPQSGACKLAAGFNAIAIERTACGTTKGVAFGHTGYRRWGFGSAPKIDAFLPTTAVVTLVMDQCNPGPATARPEVGRAFALALSIALSDAGTLPAPGGVPLGELVRTAGPCLGLTVREIARRAEVVVSGATLGGGACSDVTTLDAEVTAINAGFRNCQTVMQGVALP